MFLNHVKRYPPDINAHYEQVTGIPLEDCVSAEFRYIIDTRGHLEFAAIADNADIDMSEIRPLNNAILDVIHMIEDDVASVEDEYGLRFVQYTVDVEIYGYGNRKIHLHYYGVLYRALWEDQYYLDKCNYLATTNDDDLYIMIDVNDALSGRPKYKRGPLREIVKYLAEPIQRFNNI